MIEWLTVNHWWILILLIVCGIWIIRRPPKTKHHHSVSSAINLEDLSSINLNVPKSTNFGGGSAGGAGSSRSFISPDLAAVRLNQAAIIHTSNTDLSAISDTPADLSETITSASDAFVAQNDSLTDAVVDTASEVVGAATEAITEAAAEIVTNILN